MGVSQGREAGRPRRSQEESAGDDVFPKRVRSKIKTPSWGPHGALSAAEGEASVPAPCSQPSGSPLQALLSIPWLQQPRALGRHSSQVTASRWCLALCWVDGEVCQGGTTPMETLLWGRSEGAKGWVWLPRLAESYLSHLSS